MKRVFIFTIGFFALFSSVSFLHLFSKNGDQVEQDSLTRDLAASDESLGQRVVGDKIEQAALPSLLPIAADDQNRARVNGLWMLVQHYQIHSTEKGEKKENFELPQGEKNRFYIQLRKESVAWMTQLTEDRESQVEYFISAFSGKEITLFKTLSSSVATKAPPLSVGIDFYQLRLLERDHSFGGARDKKEGREERKSKKEDKGKTQMELTEVYDRNLQRVINRNSSDHYVNGYLEMNDKKVINNISAQINDFELTPRSFDIVAKGDYDYAASNNRGNSIIGKAQVVFMNKNEANVYFISGAYRGYTLIFSKRLPPSELAEKRRAEDEKRERRELAAAESGGNLVRVDYIPTHQSAEEREVAQEEAVRARTRVAGAVKLTREVRAQEQGRRVQENETTDSIDGDNTLIEEKVKMLGGFNFSR